jgi:hypothetical protein
MTEYTMFNEQVIDLGNQTSCIPVVEVIKSLPYLVLKEDALKLGAITLMIGIVLGAVTTYFLMKAIQERKEERERRNHAK